MKLLQTKEKMTTSSEMQLDKQEEKTLLEQIQGAELDYKNLLVKTYLENINWEKNIHEI